MIENIFKLIEKNLRNIYIWLVLGICALPLGFVYSCKYFFISAACFLVCLINAGLYCIRQIKIKNQEKNLIKHNIINFYNSLDKEEQNLFLELIKNEIAERKTKDFPLLGACGLRTENFYSLTNIYNEDNKNPIIEYKIDNQKYCFKMNQTAREYYKKLFNKYIEYMEK